MDRRGIEIGGEVARAAGVPDDLDATVDVPHAVPDIRRRRITAWILAIAAAATAGGVVAGLPAGLLVVAGLLAAGAVWSAAAAHPLRVTAQEALTVAGRESGFPVGHSSATVGFDGWRSRPIWNVLLFSADDPPTRRGLVRIDGVSGRVVGSYVEPVG
jgi:hypothetical protein